MPSHRGTFTIVNTYSDRKVSLLLPPTSPPASNMSSEDGRNGGDTNLNGGAITSTEQVSPLQERQITLKLARVEVVEISEIFSNCI